MKQRIKNICLVAVSLFGSQIAFAQLLPIQYDTLERSNEIILSGGLDYSGSAVENQLLSKFIRGGLITTEIKDASDARHKEINRIGGLAMADLEYRNFNVKIFKKRDWGMLIKTGYYAHGGAVYTAETYGLAFYGNDRYVGDTIFMGGLDFTFAAVQKIGFGVIDCKSKSNVSINLYNLSSRIDAGFRELSLGQSTDGQEVEVVMDGQVEMRNNTKFSQGIGLGVDVDFILPVAWRKDQTAYIQVLAKNIGFAYLHEAQKAYRVDTTINFTGLEFEDVIGDNAIALDSVNVLEVMGIGSATKNRTILLPGFIQVGKIVDSHHEGVLQSFFGIRLYPSLIYIPYAYAGLQAKATDWLTFGANVGYGGFTNFRGGLYANMDFKNISFGVATENIVGLVSKKGNGQSLYLRLRCAF